MNIKQIAFGLTIMFFFVSLAYPITADTESSGYVFGSIVDKSGLPIVHAEVCAIPIGESGSSKCFYTDENGEYLFSVTSGENIITVSKTGYITNSSSITINTNASHRVDFVLSKLESFNLDVEDMSNEFVEYVISDETLSGLIGACVNVTSVDISDILYYQDGLTVEILEISSGNISFSVDSDVVDFETIVFVRIDDDVLVESENIQVLFDQKTISKSTDIAEFFTTNQENASWISAKASDELFVFINIPSFSAHTITIISEPVDNLPMIILYVVVFVLLGFGIILPIVYYKRKKH